MKSGERGGQVIMSSLLMLFREIFVKKNVPN